MGRRETPQSFCGASSSNRGGPHHALARDPDACIDITSARSAEPTGRARREEATHSYPVDACALGLRRSLRPAQGLLHRLVRTFEPDIIGHARRAGDRGGTSCTHPQDRATRARPRAAAHSGTDPRAFNSATPAPPNGGATRAQGAQVASRTRGPFLRNKPTTKLRSCPGVRRGTEWSRRGG